jgi:serine protease Do
MLRNLSLVGFSACILAIGTVFGGAPDCVCSPAMISKAFTDVAKKATPAVVFLKVESAPLQDEDMYGGANPFNDDFFRRFFGKPPGGPQKPQTQISQGSGFFVSADGYILTNAHVVNGADKITVVFNDGRELDGSVVGTDSHTDIAVVKVEGKKFPFLTLGDSDAIDIAEWVIAIGSPFQLEASVTVGVVSAKGRQNLRINDYEDFIQTDAAINPGNSGGPLLNLNGDVIGINTAIFSRNGGYMGIGFAIPSKMAKYVMTQIIESGVVTRGFLGVSLQPIDKDLADAFGLEKAEGALITEVVKGSPADKSGLKQGDIILEYNKISVKSLGSFRNELAMMSPGSKIIFKINRKGEILTIPVTIGTAPDTMAAGGVVSKMGIEIDNLTPDLASQLGYSSSDEGVVITKVKPGSAAAQAGIRPGCLIQSVNHKKIRSLDDFNKALAEAGNQKRILLLIRQGSTSRYYTFKIE